MKLDEKVLYAQMNIYEEQIKAQGYKRIIGVDEVGRGPLAGSVVIAGVILDKPIYGIKDSKKLSRKKIKELSQLIKKESVAYKIIEVRASTIDKIGIKKAILQSMAKVIKLLEADFALIDFEKPKIKIDSLSMKKGDSKSNSIAAASIIAKNFRDTKMEKIALKYPDYGFEKHVGYGTKYHIQKISEHGIIENIHRKSYQPIKKMCEKK